MLSNVKILDITQVVSGSFASMTLADMGADVLKIDRPDGGEIGRHNPPFVDGMSSYFASVNRNKKSMAINLKSDAGREVFLDLAETADVIVENFRPGAMDRFGIDYDSVAERNPGIIYCSITGFGQTGPYNTHPALDIIIQGMSGNMSITGPPGSQPYRAGIPLSDIAGAMYAVHSIVAALYNREQTGEGQYIDVSMLDGTLAWLTVRAGWTFGNDRPYPRMGNDLDEFVPYGVFETKDSYLSIVVVQSHHWRKLCESIDRPELADDERFDTPEARRENRDELKATLEGELGRRTSKEWFEIMREKGVPAGPIYDTLEVWNDEHVRSRELLSDVELGDREFPVVEHPVKFSESSVRLECGVPDLGDDSVAELRALDYDAETIKELFEEGAVGGPVDS